MRKQKTGKGLNLRWPLIILIYGLIVLVVTFAVLCGASQLSAVIGDSQGAALLWRIAAACLILLVINILLLIGILSVKALDEVLDEVTEMPGEAVNRGDDDPAAVDP
jgi:hypothetical protein